MPNDCRWGPRARRSLALGVLDAVGDDDRIAAAVAFDQRLDVAQLAAVGHEKLALLNGPAAAAARIALTRDTAVASARAAFGTSARGVSPVATEAHARGVRVTGDLVVLESAPRAGQEE